jgi:hypothetical protein
MRRTGIVWKALWGLLALTLLALEATACGGGAESTSSGAAHAAAAKHGSSPQIHARYAVGDYDRDDYEAGGDADVDNSVGRLDHDGDVDGEGGAEGEAEQGGLADGDDSDLREYRQPASMAETRTVATLVRRYLSAAAAADGTRACSMVLPSIAKTVASVLTGPGEPPYSRGKTCSEVLSKIFRFYHVQLAAEARLLRVAKLGRKGDKGLAVLSASPITAFPIRVMTVQRYDGAWKIDGVLDQEQS